MIELVIKNYLDGQLSVPVFLERPEKPPKKYVLFEKRVAVRAIICLPLLLLFKAMRRRCMKRQC